MEIDVNLEPHQHDAWLAVVLELQLSDKAL
jgi:hypothetical protein